MKSVLNYIVQRFSDDGNSSLSTLSKKIDVGSKRILHFMMFVLEDEFRETKVPGETRISAGRYKLSIRKEETPSTIRHREMYNKNYKTPWFEYHIEITGINNFSFVYMHAGFNDKWTDGCPLLGFQATKINGHQSLGLSIEATKAFYEDCYPHLEDGGDAYIEFIDEPAVV